MNMKILYFGFVRCQFIENCLQRKSLSYDVELHHCVIAKKQNKQTKYWEHGKYGFIFISCYLQWCVRKRYMTMPHIHIHMHIMLLCLLSSHKVNTLEILVALTAALSFWINLWHIRKVDPTCKTEFFLGILG